MRTVRAREDGRLFDDFRDKNVVAIGWNELGDLSPVSSSGPIRDLVRKRWSTAKPGSISMTTSQVSRFRLDIKVDDWVVTYDPEKRAYLVGFIKTDYRYDPSLLEYHHIRNVKWRGEVPRDQLSTSTKNTLGATTEGMIRRHMGYDDGTKAVFAKIYHYGESAFPSGKKVKLVDDFQQLAKRLTNQSGTTKQNN